MILNVKNLTELSGIDEYTNELIEKYNKIVGPNISLNVAFGNSDLLDKENLDDNYLCFTNKPLKNNRYMICDLNEENIKEILLSLMYIVCPGVMNIDNSDINKLFENKKHFVISSGTNFDLEAALGIALNKIKDFDIKKCSKIIFKINTNETIKLIDVTQSIQYLQDATVYDIDYIFGSSLYLVDDYESHVQVVIV